MKATLVFLTLLVCCICLTMASPAPADQQPNVQFLKYRNDQDIEAIKQQIIAQYDGLGGSSQFHEEQSASYVDPHTLRINL